MLHPSDLMISSVRPKQEGLHGASRKLEIGLLLLLTAGVESFFASYFPEGLYLDLPLVWALYIGWYSSPAKGAACGLVFGWIHDVVSGVLLGMNGFSKTLVGFGGAYLNKWLVMDSWFSKCFLIGFLSIFDNVMIVVMGNLLGQHVPSDILKRSIIEAIVTGIAGMAIFEAYDYLKSPIKDFRQR